MSVRDHPLTFAGAGVQPIQAVGQYLRVLESTSPVYVEIDGGTELKRNQGGVINLGNTFNFKRLRIRSAVAQSVLLVSSEVPQDDSAQNVAVNASATVENGNQNLELPKVACATGATTLLAAAKAGRKALRVSLSSGAVGEVSLGGSGMVANEGGLIEPGMVDYIDTEGALYARNDSGASIDVWVMEINRV